MKIRDYCTRVEYFSLTMPKTTFTDLFSACNIDIKQYIALYCILKL